MSIKDYLTKNEMFSLEECSSEDLLEILENSQIHLLKNSIDHIARHWEFRQIQNIVQKIASENSSFREELIERLEIPVKMKIQYQPGNPTPEFLSLNSDQQSELQALVGIVDSVPLNLTLVKNSLTQYEIEKEPSLCQKIFSHLRQNAAFNVVMASVVVGMFSASYMNKLSHESSQSVIQHVEVSPVSGFSNTYNEVMKDLSKSKNPKIKEVSRVLASLSDGDLKSVESEDSVAEHTESKIEEISEVIESFYKDKNPAHIKKIQSNLPKVIEAVFKYSAKYDVDYRIILAILKTESDFENLQEPNATGDIGIGQVNIESWTTYFATYPKRFRPLDVERIKKDVDYAIDRTTEILALRKKGYGQDPVWYARYHNNKFDKKMAYAKKVNGNIHYIKTKEKDQLETKLASMMESLESVHAELAENENINYDQLRKLNALMGMVKQQVQFSNQKGPSTIVAMEKTSI